MASTRKESSTLLSRYFSDIREYPLLTKEQEQGLARNVRKGCRVSLHGLVESNLSFVVKVASEYRWIRKSILKSLSEHSSLVRVPTYQMKKVREIRDTEDILRRSLGRKPKREEISKKLDRSVNKIDQVLQFTLREMSLEDKVGKERDTPIADYLVDDNLTTPEDDLIKREANSLVSEAMESLTEQERTVLCHRFGIAGGPTLTLKEIGQMMNISRERVRQVECQAKNRMKKIFARKRVVTSNPSPSTRATRTPRRLRG